MNTPNLPYTRIDDIPRIIAAVTLHLSRGEYENAWGVIQYLSKIHELILFKFIHPNELVKLLTSLINNLRWYYTTSEREVWYINQIRDIIRRYDIPEVNTLLCS